MSLVPQLLDYVTHTNCVLTLLLLSIQHTYITSEGVCGMNQKYHKSLYQSWLQCNNFEWFSSSVLVKNKFSYGFKNTRKTLFYNFRKITFTTSECTSGILEKSIELVNFSSRQCIWRKIHFLHKYECDPWYLNLKSINELQIFSRLHCFSE